MSEVVVCSSNEEFRAVATPEAPMRVVYEVPVSDQEATRTVGKWLIWYVGTAVMARTPRLQLIGDARLWEVPLYVSLPSHDAVGPFHWIRVDAVTGTLLLAPDEVDVIRTKSAPIIYQLEPSLKEKFAARERRREAHCSTFPISSRKTKPPVSSPPSA